MRCPVYRAELRVLLLWFNHAVLAVLCGLHTNLNIPMRREYRHVQRSTLLNVFCRLIHNMLGLQQRLHTQRRTVRPRMHSIQLRRVCVGLSHSMPNLQQRIYSFQRAVRHHWLYRAKLRLVLQRNECHVLAVCCGLLANLYVPMRSFLNTCRHMLGRFVLAVCVGLIHTVCRVRVRLLSHHFENVHTLRDRWNTSIVHHEGSQRRIHTACN
jgi:hypothetical protein